LFQFGHGVEAVIDIALEAAVREPRCDFPDVTIQHRLAAERAEALQAGEPTVHQDELHVASLRERIQVVVSVGPRSEVATAIWPRALA